MNNKELSKQLIEDTVDNKVDNWHFDWFKNELIKNGAPDTITDQQVRSSASFAHSLNAFTVGYSIGVYGKSLGIR